MNRLLIYSMLAMGVLLGVVAGAQAGSPAAVEERFDGAKTNASADLQNLSPPERVVARAVMDGTLLLTEGTALVVAWYFWAIERPAVAFAVGSAVGASVLWTLREVFGS